jgi:large subunit ribosomal protein L3
MTRVFDEAGRAIPVTVIEAGPCPILQLKTVDSDGYLAVQAGFEELPERKVNKAQAGHAKKSGAKACRVVREFRVDEADAYAIGDVLDASLFEAGEKIDVVGVTKGRGFQGTIKRYGGHRGPESHGSMYHRRPGSAGASATPSRTIKGKKMPGRMGADRRTVQNLRVARVDAERNLILVRGSVPGHNNGYVLLAKAAKLRAPKRNKYRAS